MTWVWVSKTFTGSEMMARYGCRVNLVVCQKSKVNDWVEHFKKHYPDCSVYDLTKKDQLMLFFQYGQYRHEFSPTVIGVINYELAWRRKDLLKLTDFTLMLDESSLIQNKAAKQTKFILSLNPAHTILLSGTPVSGKYENLWTQLHLLGWNISEDLYNRQYVNWTYVESDGFFHKVVDKDNPYKNTERLRQKLRTFGADFLKTEDCFQLPGQTIIPVYVETSKEYRRFMKHSIVELPDGTELIGDQIFTKRMYSRQLCGQYSKAKIEAFRELLQSTNDRLIVFYNFTAELEELETACHDAERPFSLINGSCKRLDEYEKYEDSVTLIQYRAGSKGLNLQKANKTVYFSLTESVDDWMQSQKRTHRIGQPKPCFYWILMCKDSIEEHIYAALQRGTDFTDALFEEVIR